MFCIDTRMASTNPSLVKKICRPKALILTALLTGTFCLQAEDTRFVSGMQVDLQPIHDWVENKEGARPLPHWKETNLKSVDGMVATYTKATVEFGGKKMQVLLLNSPKDIEAMLAKRQKLSTEVALEQQTLTRERERVERLDAITPTSASGDPGYVESVMAQRRKVNEDAVKLKHNTERLEEKVKELSTLEEKISAFSDYAMLTGKTYGGFPFLDFGLKK